MPTRTSTKRLLLILRKSTKRPDALKSLRRPRLRNRRSGLIKWSLSRRQAKTCRPRRSRKLKRQVLPKFKKYPTPQAKRAPSSLKTY
jgi:hypothetical protein